MARAAGSTAKATGWRWRPSTSPTRRTIPTSRPRSCIRARSTRRPRSWTSRRAVTATETPYSLDEVATGIHRVESDLGPRFMAQYVLTGTARTVLVDTGLASTPDAVLEPALARLGRAPDVVITSHADVDHCGGNAAIRARFPLARFACHAADRAWIESTSAMLAGNYEW